MEVAHRLFQTEGKCEAIHGHSMWVDLELLVDQNRMTNGMYVNAHGTPLEFGIVKALFRGHLDRMYDHHLLLNQKDPFAQPLYTAEGFSGLVEQPGENQPTILPGLQTIDGDPTTENLAKKIAEWSAKEFQVECSVIVHETLVNAAAYAARLGV